MGLPAPRIGYDGMIQVGMSKIQVSDGMMQLGQRRFFVEDDGDVLDEQQRVVARVKDGKLGPPQKGGANDIKE